ncbi:MAG: MATE family efflux transporter [Elusimicrobium sp.]|jgi:MATE family multidrug resistance protein|nr:MATE family efflux transporter [Elusimicrobium sp.]
MENSETHTSIKELWRISYPLIVTNACVVFMQFADRVFLSWYSPAALAASVPGGSLSFTFVSLFMGLAMYTGVFVAQYDGKNRRANIAVSLWQGIIVSLISGVVIALCTPAGFWLIDVFKHAPEVVVLEKQYFGILNYGGGFVILNSALAAFFIGRGKTRVPMFVSVLGNMANIALAYILIFGRFGLPSYGISGAAWAVIISNIIMIFIYISFIFTARNIKKYRITRLAGFYKPAFFKLLSYGVPNGFSFFMDVLSFSMFSFMMGHLDMLSLGASNIVLTMQMMSFMPLLGLSVGVQILTGRYMGMKKREEVYGVVKNACKLGFSYAGALAFMFVVIPGFFIGLFLESGAPLSSEITRLALPLMKIVALFIIGDCTYLMFGEAIRGAGDTKAHMIIMFVSAWIIMIPGTYYIVYILKKDIIAVWLWFTFYSFLTAALMLVRFFQGRWRKIDITA